MRRIVSCIRGLFLLFGIFSLAIPSSSQLGLAQSSNQIQPTATVLVIDVSGSMADYWQDGIKLVSAQQAANQIINMIEQDNSQGANHKVGIVSFSDEAFRNLDLTTNFHQAREVIGQLDANNFTNMYEGLNEGNAVMSQADRSDKRIMILLSDGLSNRGPDSNDILSGPVAQAANQGVCIYTIGFGDPGDLDEDLLMQIAAASGCGQYFYANDLFDLESIYIRIRHVSGAKLLGEFEGFVEQGETVEAGRIQVTPDISTLQLSLHWQGSKMELKLFDPNGAEVKPTDSQVNYSEYRNLTYVILDQPIPGEYVIKVLGIDVPGVGERFRVLASGVVSFLPMPTIAFPTPHKTESPIITPKQSGGFGIALVLLIVAISVLGLFVYQNNLRRNQPISPTRSSISMNTKQEMNLMFINGPFTGQVFSYGLSSFSIGRGSANQLRIPDIAVSRLHAIISYQNGVWMIRDQKSRSGTFVNGFPITSAVLKHGDTIMIGTSQISVRMK